MSFPGLLGRSSQMISLPNPDLSASPTSLIIDWLSVACALDQRIGFDFLPALPKKCVGQFYAVLTTQRKSFFAEIAGNFAIHRLAHRLCDVTHISPEVTHILST